MTAGCKSEADESKNPYDRPHDANRAIEVSTISPVSGGIGTKVIVTGDNFGNNPEQVKLYFNEKEALILRIQDNAIYALTPRQPGEFSDIKVVVGNKEAVLDGMRFQYFIKAAVTTVAGQFGSTAAATDGPALQAIFGRPIMVAASNDGLVFISDDTGTSLRLLSTKDNVVTTVINGLNRPWQSAFNIAEDKLFVVEREASNRPILFYVLSRNTNWMQREIFYDQKDEHGDYIAGSMPQAGLAADDTYVYMICQNGEKLIRVHQETKKVEVIGENFSMAAWNYLAWSQKDKKLYASAEEFGRLYRFDPYYIPEGRDTPWLTFNEVEHIAGTSRGSAQEGNGLNIRMSYILGIAADKEGNIYLPDDGNSCIWKIDQELNGTIIAGVPGTAGYKDGDPKEALFNRPYGVSVTEDGLIYVAENVNKVVRCIAIQ
jgi:DNA-binding beta-propeller fold protein YncE